MKPLNLKEQFVGRVLTQHLLVGLKPDLRLQSLTTITIAVTLLSCIPAASADPLGRLFFTPEQRRQLDYAHARNAPLNGNSSAILTVNGIVQKDGGARTVWVNGVSQNADNSGERTPSAQTVNVPGKSRPVKLKVGDKILLDHSAPASQGSSAE